MAGYMTKLNSYIYEGEFQAMADTKIGSFVVKAPITASATGKIDKRMAVEAVGDTKAVCIEVGYIYGDTKAARYICTGTGAKGAYLVEQNLTHYDEIEYDMPQDVVKAEGFLRAHPISVGEEFWQSIEGTTDPTIGTEYSIGANGFLA